MTLSTRDFAKVAYETMVHYAEADPTEEMDVWREFTLRLEQLYTLHDGLSYNDITELGTILNPDIQQSEVEIGHFAWIIDNALDVALGRDVAPSV